MLSHPPHPDEPIKAVCAASYYADLVPAFAFVFRVESTDTRFTVYATEQHRWLINGTYTLTISEPDQVPLWLSADEAAFLRHCLGLVAQRWQDATGEAGAERQPTDEHDERTYTTDEITPCTRDDDRAALVAAMTDGCQSLRDACRIAHDYDDELSAEIRFILTSLVATAQARLAVTIDPARLPEHHDDRGTVHQPGGQP